MNRFNYKLNSYLSTNRRLAPTGVTLINDIMNSGDNATATASQEIDILPVGSLSVIKTISNIF
jgi:hypothetical protein